jgi:hypothetical protein
MIIIQFTLYIVIEQLSKLFKHRQLYHKLILNAFLITLACAFCSCLLSCSEKHQLQEKSPQSYKLAQDIMIDKNNMIQTINQITELATHEMNQNNWISANYHLKIGLDTLGYRYTSLDIIDDSGMKLIVGDIFERKGQLEQAARLRMQILESRLNLFKLKP